MSEPIKTYELKVDPYDCGMIPVPRNGEWMRTEDFEAAIESARAEAFQMGQEEMREQCADAFFHMPAVATAIRNLPLKDKP